MREKFAVDVDFGRSWRYCTDQAKRRRRGKLKKMAHRRARRANNGGNKELIRVTGWDVI